MKMCKHDLYDSKLNSFDELMELKRRLEILVASSIKNVIASEERWDNAIKEKDKYQTELRVVEGKLKKLKS